MKKLAVFFLITVVNFNLFCTTLPYDTSIGKVVLPQSDDSVSFIEKAVKEKYTPSWLLEFVDEGAVALFDATFKTELTNLLPLSLPIFSKNDNIIKVRDLKSDKILTFALSEEGKIIAFSVQ